MKYNQSKPYIPIGGMNPDPAGQLISDSSASLVLNMRPTGTVLTSRGGSIRLGTNGVTDPILHYHNFKQADGSELYFAFTKNNIFKYNFTSSLWESCLDTGFPISTDVSFWSTTDFVDLTYGPIVVAAGSNPPLEDLAETDGAARVMKMYNPSTGKFTKLPLKETVQVVFEEVGTIAFTLNTFTIAHSPAVGYFSLATVEDGVLAYYESIPNLWLGPEMTKVPGASISLAYVNNANTIKFVPRTTVYTGKKLYATYWYRVDTNIAPRYVATYANRLIYMNTYENNAGVVTKYTPWRIRYGAPGDVGTLNTTDYQELITTDVTPIVGVEKLGEYLYIFKKDSIHKISYIGGSLILATQCVWSEGTIYGRTIVAADNLIYYMGKDDVYVFDGNIPESLTKRKDSDNKIRDEIIARIVPSKANQVFACHNPVDDEYWLWVPSSTETYPTTCYVYSIKYGTWVKFSTAVEISSTGLGKTTQSSVSTAVKYVMLAGASTYNTVAYSGFSYVCVPTTATDFHPTTTGSSGLAITSTLVTKDFVMNDMLMQDRIQRVEFEGKGTSVTVTWDGAFTSAPAQSSSTIALTSSFARYNYHPDCVVDQVRFQFTSTSSLSLRTMIVYALAFTKTNQ